jgi:hypothetical protein
MILPITKGHAITKASESIIVNGSLNFDVLIKIVIKTDSKTPIPK